MIEFTMVDTLPSKNEHKGSHWGSDQKVHDEWAEKTQFAVLEQCAEEDYPDSPVILEIQCFEPTKRIKDTLNYASQGAHGIQDGLVKLGIIEDDNWKYIQDCVIRYGRSNDQSFTKVSVYSKSNFELLVEGR